MLTSRPVRYRPPVFFTGRLPRYSEADLPAGLLDLLIGSSAEFPFAPASYSTIDNFYNHARGLGIDFRFYTKVVDGQKFWVVVKRGQWLPST